MIKVQFKNNYDGSYGGREYVYKDYENAEVGDIVVANTRSGYAIAKVSQINVLDIDIELDKISTIEKVIITKKELDEKAKKEYNKKVKINEFVNQAKRKIVLGHLSGLTTDENCLKELAKLDTNELELIAKMLIK